MTIDKGQQWIRVLDNNIAFYSLTNEYQLMWFLDINKAFDMVGVTRWCVFIMQSSYPIERIAEIHRYQPVVSDLHEESMKIQNLRQHFGATLNSENYVKYYTEQG